MTQGAPSRQPDLFKSTAYVAERVPENSIWAVLAHHGERLFPDEMFADLFSPRGRRPPCLRRVVCATLRSTIERQSGSGRATRGTPDAPGGREAGLVDSHLDGAPVGRSGAAGAKRTAAQSLRK